MDILDFIISCVAEAGNGTVSYFEKKGALYFISTVYPEHTIELFIVPKDDWKKLSKFFEKQETDACGDPVSEDTEELFWDKMSKYSVGEFDPN